MKRTVVLLELVGEQSIPNLIPVLEYRPDEVVLLVSGRTERHAHNTQAALQMMPDLLGVRFTVVKVDPYSIVAAEKAIDAVLDRHPGAEFIFNITGGTKTMVVGMYRVACRDPWRERGRMVYVSTEVETEQTIAGDEFHERRLETQIPAGVYLSAHGVSLGTPQPAAPSSWTAVALELARQVEADAREGRQNRTTNQLLARIHRAAFGLKDQQLRERPVCIPRKTVRVAGLNVLRRCQDAGVLADLTLKGGEVCFRLNGSLALRFLDGHWLEVYVGEMARRTEVFHDVLVSVPIVHPQWGHKELDVVAMRGVVAVICSCKTGKTPQGPARNLPLDELEARSRTLGRYCGKVFVTSRRGYGGAMVSRAAGMGVHVVGPRALTAVGDVLVEASHSKGHPFSYGGESQHVA
jgi:hypothetical protein